MNPTGNLAAYNHKCLNLLTAILAGQCVHDKTIEVLGSMSRDPHARPYDCVKKLECISGWLTECSNGVLVFGSFEERSLSCRAQEVLTLFDLVRVALLDEAKSVSLSINVSHPSQDDAYVLAAAVAQYTYARMSFLEENVKHAFRCCNRDQVQFYQPLLNTARGAFNGALHTVERIRVGVDRSFFSLLVEASFGIPAANRAYVHEIAQLRASLFGGFNFESGDFSEEEVAVWCDHGIDAVEAGYWKAYGIAPSDAPDWKKAGIVAPEIAHLWKFHDFTPEVAIEWMSHDISPLAAAMWAASGFSPREASTFIHNGLPLPAELTSTGGAHPRFIASHSLG